MCFRKAACPSYESFEAWNILYFVLFATCWVVYVLIEIAQLIEFKRNYFKDEYNWFQWIIIIITPVSALQELENVNIYDSVIAIALLWFNISFAIRFQKRFFRNNIPIFAMFFFHRNTRIIGKYILMFTEVLWTFVKLIIPFFFFLFVLAMASFSLYYKVAFQLAIGEVFKEHPTVLDDCNNLNYTAYPEHVLNQFIGHDWEWVYSLRVSCKLFNCN